MTDAEYVFNQDIRDKKRIGRGSFNKKCGSKSKKCTLPSEYLSRKEKKKLNSTVTEWNLNKFYSLADFKSMPNDLKVEYVNRLLDSYEISIKVIAEELFNTCDSYFRKILIQNDIYDKIHTRSGFRTKKESIDRFQTAILKQMEPKIDESPKENDIPDTTLPEENKKDCTELAYFSGELTGSVMKLNGFNYDVFNFLENQYRGKKIEVIINVNVIE